MSARADGEMPLRELRAAIAEAAAEIASGKGLIVSDPRAIAESIIGGGRARLESKP